MVLGGRVFRKPVEELQGKEKEEKKVEVPKLIAALTASTLENLPKGSFSELTKTLEDGLKDLRWGDLISKAAPNFREALNL